MLVIVANRLINEPITIAERNRRFSNEKVSLSAKIKDRTFFAFFLIIYSLLKKQSDTKLLLVT